MKHSELFTESVRKKEEKQQGHRGGRASALPRALAKLQHFLFFCFYYQYRGSDEGSESHSSKVVCAAPPSPHARIGFHKARSAPLNCATKC